MAKYSYFGLDNEWATYDLMEAAERARWLAWGIGFLGIALVAICGKRLLCANASARRQHCEPAKNVSAPSFTRRPWALPRSPSMGK